MCELDQVTDSETCLINPSSDAASDADELSSLNAPWLRDMDGPVEVPRIESLFELVQAAENETHPENAFWEWVIVNAAMDVHGELLSGATAVDQARHALYHRRLYDWDREHHNPNAEAAIVGEINCFLKRVFQGDEMATTRRQPKSSSNGDLKVHDPDDDKPGFTLEDDEDEGGNPKRPFAGPVTNAEQDLIDRGLLGSKPGIQSIRQAEQSAAVKRNGKGAAKVETNGQHEPTASAKARIVILSRDVDIELKLIDDSPFQTREEPPLAEIADLAKSLDHDGQRDSVRLRSKENGRYEAIAGHRRVRAAKSLLWTTIRATIEIMDDAEASRQVFDDNEQRQSLNQIERAKGLQVIWAQYEQAGKSMRDMAADLGMEQGTISNRIRILTAPESLQKRLISGEITEARLRGLATWAKYEGLLKAFESELANRCDKGPVSLNHWASSLVCAINRVSKPMRKANWEKDPARHFEPNEEQLRELDVILVKVEGHYDTHGEKRAFNVKLWNKLQNEAKKKKADREKKKSAAAETEQPASKKAQRTDRDSYLFRRLRDEAWTDPLWEKFEEWMKTGKKTKPQKQQLARLVSLYQPEADFIVKTIAMTADAYADECIADMTKNSQFFHVGDLEAKEIEQITAAFGIEIASTWKPTKELLDCCELIDLHDIAEEINVHKHDKKEDLVELLLDLWPAGHVPDLLALHPPKKAAKAK